MVPQFLPPSLERLGIPGYRVLRWETAVGRHASAIPPPGPNCSVATNGTHDVEPNAAWYKDAAAASERHQLAHVPGLQRLEAGPSWGAEVRDLLLQVVYGGALAAVDQPDAGPAGDRRSDQRARHGRRHQLELPDVPGSGRAGGGQRLTRTAPHSRRAESPPSSGEAASRTGARDATVTPRPVSQPGPASPASTQRASAGISPMWRQARRRSGPLLGPSLANRPSRNKVTVWVEGLRASVVICRPRASRRKGCCSSRSTDTQSGKSFRFYDFEHTVALALDGRPLDAVAADLKQNAELELSPDQLASFADQLEALGFLENGENAERSPRARRRRLLPAADRPRDAAPSSARPSSVGREPLDDAESDARARAAAGPATSPPPAQASPSRRPAPQPGPSPSRRHRWWKLRPPPPPRLPAPAALAAAAATPAAGRRGSSRCVRPPPDRARARRTFTRRTWDRPRCSARRPSAAAAAGVPRRATAPTPRARSRSSRCRLRPPTPPAPPEPARAHRAAAPGAQAAAGARRPCCRARGVPAPIPAR